MAISHWEDALAKLAYLDAEDTLDQLAIPVCLINCSNILILKKMKKKWLCP